MKKNHPARSREENRKYWEGVAKRYAKRKWTAKEFADQEGIKLCTLSYHLTRLNNEATAKTPGFVPLVAHSEGTSPAASVSNQQTVAIEFSSGTRIVIAG